MRLRDLAGAAAVLLGVAGTGAPAMAYPVNFGVGYVPPPGHGYAVMIPQWGLDRSSYASWGTAIVGVADRVALGVDGFALALPGGVYDLGNVTVTGYYDLRVPLPNASARAGLAAGVPAGTFGVPQLGAFGNFEWGFAPGWRTYTAVAAYANRVAALPRVALDVGVEARVLPWLGFGIETLAGAPAWEYGAGAHLGVAPSLTVYLPGDAALLLTVRTPVVATGAAPLGVATAGVGVAFGW